MEADDLFEDAQVLVERAQTHMREFKRLTGLGPGLLWDVRRSGGSGEAAHVADLVLDRSVMRACKAVLSDAANNLIHALDHVAAAARRAANLENPGDLYFPIAASDDGYAKVEKRVRKHLGPEWADLFATAREAHRPYLRYLTLVRILSGDAKHWRLTAGAAGARAVKWRMPGSLGPTIIEIPGDHFESHDNFAFWEGGEPFPDVAVHVIIGHTITGGELENVSVNSVFSTTERFVAGVIEASQNHLADTRPS